MTNTENHSATCSNAAALLGLDADEACGGDCLDADYADGYRDGADSLPLRSRPAGMYTMNYAIGYAEGSER